MVKVTGGCFILDKVKVQRYIEQLRNQLGAKLHTMSKVGSGDLANLIGNINAGGGGVNKCGLSMVQ